MLFSPPPLSETTALVSVAELDPLLVHVTAPFASHGVAPVCVSVIVVGTPTVVACEVHVYTIDNGVVPSVPTAATCVATTVSAPCGAGAHVNVAASHNVAPTQSDA